MAAHYYPQCVIARNFGILWEYLGYTSSFSGNQVKLWDKFGITLGIFGLFLGY